MKRFLLLSTEEQVECLIQWKYSELSELMEKLKEKEPKEEYSISEALDFFLDMQCSVHYNMMIIPWGIKKGARRAIKKDILCLIALTCDYWQHKKDVTKGKWNKNKFGTNISNVKWKIDFELFSDRYADKTECFLPNLKNMVLQKPEIWNELSKAAEYEIYAPYNMIDGLYAKLSPEEKYAYQYITGFSSAGSLFCSLEKENKECVLAEDIGKISGLYTRMYYTGALCKIKSLFNDLESLKNKTPAKLMDYRLYTKMYQEESSIGAKKMLNLIGTYDNKGLEDFIYDEVLDLGRTFLQELIVNLVKIESTDDWAKILWKKIEEEFNFKDEEKLKEFWLDKKMSKMEEMKKEIKRGFTKDIRCKKNRCFTHLMKVVMDSIILEKGKSAERMDFPPFGTSQIERCR